MSEWPTELLQAVDAKLAALRSEVSQLREVASERDAIATLLSDRSEVGTYAKVDALEAEVSRLRAQIRAMGKAARGRYTDHELNCLVPGFLGLADDQESQG